MADSLAVDVLQRQRQLCELTCLSANYLEEYGLQQYQCARSLSSTVFRSVPLCHHHDLHRRPNTAARLDTNMHLSRRRYWVYCIGASEDHWCTLLRRVPSLGWDVLHDPQYFGLDSEYVPLLELSGRPLQFIVLPMAKADPSLVDCQGSDTRRGAGLVLINVVGQCGPVLGTQLYPTGEGPRYVKGMSVCAAFMFFSAIMAFALRVLLVWENRKLDEKYGRAQGAPEGAAGGMTSDEKGSEVAVEDYGPDFRYVL